MNSAKTSEVPLCGGWMPSRDFCSSSLTREFEVHPFVVFSVHSHSPTEKILVVDILTHFVTGTKRPVFALSLPNIDTLTSLIHRKSGSRPTQMPFSSSSVLSISLPKKICS